MDDIEELCSRIVIMRKGQKVFDNKIETLHANYAKNKLIHAHIPENTPSSFIEDFPSELGAIFKTNNEIKITCPRLHTMEAAKYLLNQAPILDMTIQEEDIANIIEKIMNSGEFCE
jgi:ABC-type uncharacterized transport system ATPase subunit